MDNTCNVEDIYRKSWFHSETVLLQIYGNNIGIFYDSQARSYPGILDSI